MPRYRYIDRHKPRGEFVLQIGIYRTAGEAGTKIKYWNRGVTESENWKRTFGGRCNTVQIQKNVKNWKKSLFLELITKGLVSRDFLCLKYISSNCCSSGRNSDHFFSRIRWSNSGLEGEMTPAEMRLVKSSDFSCFKYIFSLQYRSITVIFKTFDSVSGIYPQRVEDCVQ